MFEIKFFYLKLTSYLGRGSNYCRHPKLSLHFKITSRQLPPGMDTNLPHQDSVTGTTNLPETPLPESQRTCLRNSPCFQQGCMTCGMPTNHVRDLNVKLNATNSINSNTNSTNTNSPTNNPTTLAKQPPNHLTVNLTTLFRNAILENDVFKLDAVMKQYANAMTSDPEFMIYDHTDLRTAHTHTMQILNVHRHLP